MLLVIMIFVFNNAQAQSDDKPLPLVDISATRLVQFGTGQQVTKVNHDSICVL